MSEISVKTVWEFYDADQHGGQGGNYILLLKAFRNAPYYSGIAGNFARRFGEHQGLFEEGMRTFMRRPFIDGSEDHSHHGFAARWDHYKQQTEEEQEKLVWVPTNLVNEAMGKEGAPLWHDGMAKLVSIRGEERASVETRVQDDIKQYYNGLLRSKIDWRVTNHANLMGDPPGHRDISGPALTYELVDAKAADAGAFFAALESRTA